MPTVPHTEKHFTASHSVRDVVIGMSDGLTVPFALAAGISGAVAATSVVVTAGLAEVAAGAIAMGLGGFLAAKTDEHHYRSERRRELRETREVPERELAEVQEILQEFGLDPAQSVAIGRALQRNPERWVEFMMRFELGLEAPDPRRAWRSALTIAGAYVLGGLLPLLPYMVLSAMAAAVTCSVVITLLALLAFGAVKARFTGIDPLKGAIQTACVGAVAAGAAFGIASFLQ